MPKKIVPTAQPNIIPKPKRKRRKSSDKQEKANQFDKIANDTIPKYLRNYVSIERTPWYKLGVAESEAKFQKKLAHQETIWMKLVKEREQEIQAKELEAEQKQKQTALLQEQKQEAFLQEQKQKEQIALQAKQQLQQMIAILLIDNHLSKEKIAFTLNISLEEILFIEAKILKIKALVATQILTVEEMAKTFEVTTIFVQLVANGI
jgi:hypothetical protein